jgi:GTP pyrophosphokinase
MNTLTEPLAGTTGSTQTPALQRGIRRRTLTSSIVQEEFRKDILAAYRSLIGDCVEFTTPEERKQIRAAFEFSLSAHGNALRKSGEPYILHPIAVARILIREMGVLDVVAIQSALLHDVVEDTFAEVDELKIHFGEQVARIVEGLTKISVPFDTSSSKQAENYRKMLLTLSHDIRVALVKIADRLHNMRTLEHMRREKQLQIASETHHIYAPLAYRLGFAQLRSELADLAIRYLDPAVYEAIVQKLAETKQVRDKYIKEFIRPIRLKLKMEGYTFRIFGRVKSISSIYEKMKKQNIPLEEVFDIFAIRIVLDVPMERESTECWKVYSLVIGYYRPNPSRLRDWVSVPKSNGYESLHTTVKGPNGQWVEVQIRSERMDYAAEKGMAAHWKYKTGAQTADERLEKWLSRVREVLENQQLTAQDFVKEINDNLFSEQIYVFTPKGRMIHLPQKATVLDFAYEIHTDIGHSAIGGKVNHNLVPLNHALTNGDQVEIITSRMAKPLTDWLDMATTSKALSKIKEHLRERRKAAIATGRRLFDRKIEQLGISEEHELVRMLLNKLNLATLEDLLFLLGDHKADVLEIQTFIQEHISQLRDTQTLARSNRIGVQADQNGKALRSAQPGEMTPEEMQARFGYRYATCCHPVPGDEIVGYLEMNNQIVVHRSNCQRLQDLLSANGQKVVKTSWNSDLRLEYRVTIVLKGQDRQGMMSTMLEVISRKMKKNIRSLNFETEGGMFTGRIRMDVVNTREVEQVIDNLRKVSGVLSVERI